MTGISIRLLNKSGSHLLSHAVSSIVPSAVWVLTVVFGMGTGVSPRRIATGIFAIPIKSGLFGQDLCEKLAFLNRALFKRFRACRATERSSDLEVTFLDNSTA